MTERIVLSHNSSCSFQSRVEPPDFNPGQSAGDWEFCRIAATYFEWPPSSGVLMRTRSPETGNGCRIAPNPLVAPACDIDRREYSLRQPIKITAQRSSGRGPRGCASAG